MLEDQCFLQEIKNDEKLAEKKKTAGNKNFQGFKKKKKSQKNVTCSNKYFKIK